MSDLTAKDLWGKVETEIDEIGRELYFKRICVGGKDDNGLYEVVLDGPASGEKVYVNDY